jgi:dolichyl-diphosphooligosaccharide--protein glycosyltransferase
VALAVLLAFGLRVIPAWDAVFTGQGIGFQEPDAWFHMRTVHNLLAHFPRHSGFDPYALYPGGQEVATDLWDDLLSAVAWVLGGGAPSEQLTDRVGAWLPAIVGALFPIPVFFLGRRLFGELAGMLSAFWVAVIPGTFLWVSHLGMPDHHAAEALTSFLALAAVCTAAELNGKARWRMSVLAGIALGVYLNIRSSGLFVPGVLALGAVAAPSLAPVVTVAVAIATAAYWVGSAGPWSGVTLLVLAGCLAAAAAAWGFGWIGRRRNWSPWLLRGAVAAGGTVLVCCVAAARPAMARSLAALILTYTPWHSGDAMSDKVRELLPLWRAAPGGFASLNYQLGAPWVLALAGLVGVVWMALRTGRPALILFALWSFTMIAGGLLQLRMTVYAGFVVSMLAGLAGVWIVEAVPPRLPWLRGLAAAILLLAGTALTLPNAIRQERIGGGPDSDSWAALNWLRSHTPEPMGDARAWYRQWPRPGPGQTFAYPPSAYGVIAQWDRGWWIDAIARRIPVSNGTQAGAAETAHFLIDREPEEGRRYMRASGSRYVLLGAGQVTNTFPALVSWAGRDIAQYSRLFYVAGPDGQPASTRVYLPAYFRSMAARLYLFDGRRMDSAAGGATVFITDLVSSPKGPDREMVRSVRHFASEKEASAWIAAHPLERAVLASADPTQPCVDLEELPWLRRVYASNNEAIQGGRQPTVEKVFALVE